MERRILVTILGVDNTNKVSDWLRVPELCTSPATREARTVHVPQDERVPSVNVKIELSFGKRGSSGVTNYYYIT